MTAEEIRRRKTSDPEMDAIVTIAQALGPLDTEACRRVLKWAEDRFIEEPKRQVSELAWASVHAQIEAYKKYGEDLGVDDRTLAHALAHVRGAKGLAPIDSDADPEATIAEATDAMRGKS